MLDPGKGCQKNKNRIKGAWSGQQLQAEEGRKERKKEKERRKEKTQTHVLLKNR